MGEEVVGGNLIVNLLILRYPLSSQMEMLSRQLSVYCLLGEKCG